MTVVSPAVPYARRGRHSVCPTPTPGTLVALPVMDRLRGLGSAGAVASEALPGRRCGTFLARVGGGGREIAVRTPRSGSRAAMRYNEKELQALSRQPAELAAELGMRGPKKGSGEWGRAIRLVCPQPVGALLLEHCRVAQEEPSGFSISFIEDPERKYHFECYSEEQCQEWMGALRRASYEFMRRSLIFYRNEIQKMTGKDPLEQFGISEEARFQLSGVKA
ncbi:PREDICTED: pleckstrin homology domain-containing family J member 1 isoform X2 [Myotis brandtii]|uniref:pleckstrin homology domain-containing family J member 1 isoform X2 n=1 Tax=Myotis brandtii TaxID=109478 RepID=UPI0003BBA1A2|nr:PREDICTED: pleckstrin homology domain-containing family J member 1 isoform X2 [Myotis brandtii]